MAKLAGRRFCAFILDQLVLAIVVSAPLSFFLSQGAGSGALLFAITIVTAVLSLAYWTLSDYFFGQSLGKMIVRVKTVGLDGKPRFWAAFLRSVPKLFGLLLILDSLPLLAAGSDSKRVSESLTRTKVVEWI
jgi:uncharacterized RDD family membrane protein YckC